MVKTPSLIMLSELTNNTLKSYVYDYIPVS